MAFLSLLPPRAQEALLRLESGEETALDRYWIDPGLVMADAGLKPDPWQRRVLESLSEEMALLCSRQHGKSTVTGALAVKTVLLEPPALVLMLSPTERQSIELLQDKFMRIYRAIKPGVKVARHMQTTVELANGSRVIALPSNEAGIRGYSAVSLLLIDEAAMVDDSLVGAVRPMLATSKGRFVALSTPYGKRGWFYEQWDSDEKAREAGFKTDCEQIRVTADGCPRISPEFLERERKRLGERWFRQEYHCSFEEAIDSVFTRAEIDRALRSDLQPLWEDE